MPRVQPSSLSKTLAHGSRMEVRGDSLLASDSEDDLLVLDKGEVKKGLLSL
jgi:hypothetical protein